MKLELLWKLLTGGMTPEERAAGIKFVTTAGYRGLIMFLVAWGYGALAFVGWGEGFATDNSVDAKIATAIEPIAKEQSDQRKILKTLTITIEDQLASGIATEIRYLYSKKCQELDYRERDRLQGEIDRKQREYQKYRTDRYDYDCKDV